MDFLANYFKSFLLSIQRIYLALHVWCSSLNSISGTIVPDSSARLPHTAVILEQPQSQPQPQPPQDVIQGGYTVHQENFEWSRLIIAFCFSSAIEMAVQIQSKQSTLELHLLSHTLSLAFASLFVAKLINSKFPIAARALERAGVFVAATAFFLAMSLPFPLHVKCTNWAIFAVSLLAVFACNRFL